MNSLSTPRLSHSGILLAITFFASVGCDIRTALVHSEIEDVRAGGEWKPHLDAQRAKLKVALQPHEPGDQMPLENQPANDELANLMHADNQASEIAELHDPRRLINQLAEPISNPEYRAFVLRETELQEDEIPPNAFPIFRENIELPVIDNGEVMNLIDDVSVSPYSYSVLYKLKVKQARVLNIGTYKYNNNNKNTSRSK